MQDQPNKTKPRSELLKALLQGEQSSWQYEGHYILPKGPLETSQPPGLLQAIGIDKTSLSTTAQRALEAVEELSAEIPEEWNRFLWSLAAFVQIQDLFECKIQDSDDIRSLFQQYYFYYESKSILSECILAWLEGLYIASGTLLRPFLEFSLYQNYYMRIIQNGSTYRPLEKYFGSQVHPGQNAAIKQALPDDAFCRPIKFRINAHLKALSNLSQHAYHPDASTFQHRHQPRGHSLEGLFFWKELHLILECALWIYYVNTPAAFFPIDVMRKFGFNGPVGIFADLWTAKM